MLGTNQYDLTWEHFADLHADKEIAFENLCRSLFKRELCVENAILHSDPNHPGVEVAPVLSRDGKDYISFQAKYFDNTIGSNGYKQIKRSAEQTIKHYKGELDIIYLYCNIDVTETSTSYIGIKKNLKNAGIDIILITGQTILDCVIEYPTVLSCYFGLDILDASWFQRNLQISLDNLGRRYNSLFNVNTEAQRDLSIFLREDEGIEAINEINLLSISSISFSILLSSSLLFNSLFCDLTLLNSLNANISFLSKSKLLIFLDLNLTISSNISSSIFTFPLIMEIDLLSKSYLFLKLVSIVASTSLILIITS